MNSVAVLLVAWLAFHAGQLTLYRALRGRDLEIEMCRQHVDAADTANQPLRRIAYSAIHRGRRIRESVQ